jgi:hypothetical protein
MPERLRVDVYRTGSPWTATRAVCGTCGDSFIEVTDMSMAGQCVHCFIRNQTWTYQ